MINIKTTGTKGVINVVNKTVNWMKFTFTKLPQKYADRGAYYMRSVMPYEHGGMSQAVKIEDAGNKQGWGIVVRNPKPINGKQSRPYHVWYNAGKSGRRREGVANPSKTRFFEKTYKYLEGKYPQDVERELSKLLSK